MTIRIHFAGLQPERPLTLLAAAATAAGWNRAAGTEGEARTARELSGCFGTHWSVADSIEGCDVAIHAHGYVDTPLSRAAAAACRAAGKPIASFDGTETLPPTDPALGIVYRCSAFTRLDHERGMPVFVPDPTQEVAPETSKPLRRSEQPTVGFCGFGGSRLQVAGLRLVGASQKADGLALRLRVLSALRRDWRVQCDFRVRGKYLGRATHASKEDGQGLRQARMEFLTNLFGNAYNIAMRGKGNHSNRHYETLAAGRIPLFVNTNCVLPLESDIDWRKHMVWVEETDLASIGGTLADFHDRLTSGDFEQLQQANRHLWETRLRPEPFFRRVIGALAAAERAP